MFFSKEKKREQNEEMVCAVWSSAPEEGEYSLLVHQMSAMEEEMLSSYVRMSASRFVDLLHPLHPFLNQQTTHSAPVGAAERLAVLASGVPQ